MDQFSQEEGDRKAKTLKDHEEEELEETDLIEDVAAAPQENRIKDTFKILTPSDYVWVFCICSANFFA